MEGGRLTHLINSRGFLWAGLVLVFVLFLGWYRGGGNPLTSDEVDDIVSAIAAVAPAESGFPARVRAFAETDDGKPFYVVNIVKATEAADSEGSMPRIDRRAGLAQGGTSWAEPVTRSRSGTSA